MYDGIKKALGPTQSKTARLKSSNWEIHSDKGQQMEKWVEHYYGLLFQIEQVPFLPQPALNAIGCLQIMGELDSEPSVEELSKAVDCLASGKPLSGSPDQALQDYLNAPTARRPLPVLARRSCITGHEGIQDQYPIEEQGRYERL